MQDVGSGERMTIGVTQAADRDEEGARAGRGSVDGGVGLRTTRSVEHWQAADVGLRMMSGTPRSSGETLGLFLVFEAELELDPILHDLAALYPGR